MGTAVPRQSITPTLTTIEAARGLASLSVVLFHANATAKHIAHTTFDWLTLGEHGVDFFFVLSGFIIFFVHHDDIGRPEKAKDYLLKRFIRLFPLLWLVSGGWIALRALAGQPITLGAIGTSLLLYPSVAEPVPLVVWTLRHEALFYVAVLICLLSRRVGTALFGAWTLAVCVQLGLSLSGKPISGLAAFFLSSYQLDFVLGAAVAVLHRRRAFAPSPLPLMIGLASLAVVFLLQSGWDVRRSDMLDYTSPAATAWTLVLGCGFAIVLHGLLCIEPKVTVPKVLLNVGAASYAIYLVHTPVNSLAQHVAVFLPSGLGHLFLVLCGVAAGVVLHLCFERPITRGLRSWLIESRAQGVTSPRPLSG